MRIRSAIADAVERKARQVFAGSWPTKEVIKQEFCTLGRSLGYVVNASHCDDAHFGEWLYDLVWSETVDGVFVQQPLALESEPTPDPKLDGDFLKLVQARSEVRLWACKLPRGQSLEKHLEIYEQQVNAFAGTQSGDLYIFVVYDRAGLEAHIKRFEVLDPQRHTS